MKTISNAPNGASFVPVTAKLNCPPWNCVCEFGVIDIVPLPSAYAGELRENVMIVPRTVAVSRTPRAARTGRRLSLLRCRITKCGEVSSTQRTLHA